MQAVGESLRVASPIDDVWRAWSDPDWLAGWHAERVEGDLVAGRSIQLVWDSLGIAIELDVVVADPPERLVLRGAPPDRPPQTLTITLARAGSETDLTIRHEGFASQEEKEGTAAGWHVAARVLAHYLAHHAGRPRLCTAAVAPVAARLADIEPWFARPGWLLGEEGSVLASALPRQIALAVDGGAGVLVLRAVQLDPGAALVAALAWSWQPERPAHQALLARLEPALEHLVARLGGARGGAA